MSTPLATIADALIEFILSLLRDPAAAAEFEADPDGALDRAGLGDACVDDVRAVAPVIYDRPDVHVKPSGGSSPVNPWGPPVPPNPGPPTVEKEIWNITNSFAIDNRATIVDQSVNQNIWADGDVNQIFDQEAIVNSGDNGAAAGDDAAVDNSDTDIEDSEVAIGNTDVTTDIDGSFNEETTETTTDTDVNIGDSFDDDSTEVDADVTVDDSFNDSTESSVATGVETDAAAPAADYSAESDSFTEADSFAVAEEPAPEAPVDDQP